jgi:hypothetical protein
MLKFVIAKPLLIEVQICPSLLVKDPGRPDDPKARPKASGQVNVANNVQGAELLDEDISSEGEDLDDGTEENISDANKHDANEDVKEEDEASDEDGTGQDVSNDFCFLKRCRRVACRFIIIGEKDFKDMIAMKLMMNWTTMMK